MSGVLAVEAWFERPDDPGVPLPGSEVDGIVELIVQIASSSTHDAFGQRGSWVDDAVGEALRLAAERDGQIEVELELEVLAGPCRTVMAGPPLVLTATAVDDGSLVATTRWRLEADRDGGPLALQVTLREDSTGEWFGAAVLVADDSVWFEGEVHAAAVESSGAEPAVAASVEAIEFEADVEHLEEEIAEPESLEFELPTPSVDVPEPDPREVAAARRAQATARADAQTAAADDARARAAEAAARARAEAAPAAEAAMAEPAIAEPAVAADDEPAVDADADAEPAAAIDVDPIAEDDPGNVQVWFGTTRTPKHSAGPGKSFTHSFDESLGNSYHCGVAHVDVPPTAVRGRGRLDRSLVQKVVSLDFSDKGQVKLLEVRNVGDPDTFFATLRAEVADTGAETALLYVHGYNVTFEDCVRRGAQLSFDLGHEGLTTAFTWPSRGALWAYWLDRRTVRRSEPALADFIRRLATESGVERVHIIAHSMGNRGLIHAMQHVEPVLRGSGIRLGQIILAAPDVGARRFRDLARVYPKVAEGTTLYASRRDRALKVSSFFKWANRHRAGLEPPVTVVDGVETVVISDLDLDNVMDLGHGTYASAGEMLTDMRELMTGKKAADRRLRDEIKRQMRFWRLEGDAGS